MTTNTEEYNPFLTQSSDEGMLIGEEEPLAQNKNLDIFTIFTFLNDSVQLAAKLRYYNILKNTVLYSNRGCCREMRAEKNNLLMVTFCDVGHAEKKNYSCRKLF